MPGDRIRGVGSCVSSPARPGSSGASCWPPTPSSSSIRPADVRAPLAFAYGHLLWGRDLEDPWALFAVTTHSYAGLGFEQKAERFADLMALCESVDADFQLLRVSAAWDPHAYLAEQAAGPPEHGPARRAYLAEQAPGLGDVGRARVRAYLAVRLAAPSGDVL